MADPTVPTFSLDSVPSFGGGVSQPPPSVTSTKQQQVANTSQKKAFKLELKNVALNGVSDADTIKAEGYAKSLRLGSAWDKTSLDAYETKKYYPNGQQKPFGSYDSDEQNRMEEQRTVLADQLGTDPSNISNEYIWEKGEQAANQMQQFLWKGQSNTSDAGPVRARVNVLQTQEELGKFDRYIADFQNPVTGEFASEQFNTKDFNADYDSPYNTRGQLRNENKKRAEREAEGKPFVSDERMESPEGQLINWFASIGAGGLTVAGDVTKLAPTLLKEYTERNITPEQRALFKNRALKDKAFSLIDAETVKLGKEKKYDQVNELARQREQFAYTDAENALDSSVINTLQHSENVDNNPLMNMVDALAKHYTSKVNRKAQQEVGAKNEAKFNKAVFNIKRGKELYDAGDATGAIKEVMKGMGSIGNGFTDTALNNPGVILDTFGESFIQMLGSTKTALVTFSYGMKMYSEAQDQYEKIHGEAPDTPAKGRMFAETMASALLDRLGAKAVLNKAPAKGLGIAAAKGKDLVKGFVGETVTEGTQGILEQDAALQDLSKVNYGESYNEGVLGGLGSVSHGATAKPLTALATGGAVAGIVAGAVAIEGAKSIPGVVASIPGAVSGARAANAAGKLDDPTTVSDPVAAFDGLTKPKHSIKPEDSPEAKQDKIKTLNEANQRIYEEYLSVRKGITDPKDKAGVDKAAKLLVTHRQNEEYISSLEAKEAPTPDEMQGSVDAVVHSGETDDSTQKDIVLNSIETNPESISDKQLNQLINKTDGVLTPADIKYLKAHKDTRGAMKTLKSVSDDVIYGSSDFMGLLSHIKGIAKSSRMGREKLTQDRLNDLGKFANGHINKALKFKTLLDAVNARKSPEEIKKLNIEAILAIPKNITAGVTAENYKNKKIPLLDTKNLGSFTGFVNAITSEAVALRTGYNEASLQANNVGKHNYKSTLNSKLTDQLPNLRADKKTTTKKLNKAEYTADNKKVQDEANKVADALDKQERGAQVRREIIEKLNVKASRNEASKRSKSELEKEIIRDLKDLEAFKEKAERPLMTSQQKYLDSLTATIKSKIEAYVTAGGDLTIFGELPSDTDTVEDATSTDELLEELFDTFGSAQQTDAFHAEMGELFKEFLATRNTGKNSAALYKANAVIAGATSFLVGKRVVPFTKQKYKALWKTLQKLPLKGRPYPPRRPIKPEDTLLQVIGKLGGISWDSADGYDVENNPNRDRSIPYIRSKSSGLGMTMDDMQSALQEHHFELDQGDAIDDLVEQIRRAAMGEDIYANTADLDSVLEAKYAEQEEPPGSGSEDLDVEVPENILQELNADLDEEIEIARINEESAENSRKESLNQEDPFANPEQGTDEKNPPTYSYEDEINSGLYSISDVTYGPELDLPVDALGSPKEAMEWLLENGATQRIRDIAKQAIEKADPNLKLKFSDETNSKRGEFKNNPTGDVITLYANGMNQVVLAHELFHAATSHTVENPTTKKEKALVQDISDIQDEIREALGELPINSQLTPEQRETVDYALGSLHEFGAVVSTEPDIKEALDTISPPGEQGFLVRWINKALELVGLPKIKASLLDKALYVSDRLIAKGSNTKGISSVKLAAGITDEQAAKYVKLLKGVESKASIAELSDQQLKDNIFNARMITTNKSVKKLYDQKAIAALRKKVTLYYDEKDKRVENASKIRKQRVEDLVTANIEVPGIQPRNQEHLDSFISKMSGKIMAAIDKSEEALSGATVKAIVKEIQAGITESISGTLTTVEQSKWYKAGVRLAKDTWVNQVYNLGERIVQDNVKFRPAEPDFFRAKPAKAGTGVNVLHTIENFFDTYDGDYEALGLTEEQADAIQSLKEFDKLFRDTLTDEIMVQPSARKFIKEKGTPEEEEVDILQQNPSYRLIANKTKLADKFQENFKSTMSMAVYDILAKRAEGMVNNTNAQVNSILGFDNSKRTPTLPEQELVADKGMVAAAFIRSVGSAIVNNIGIEITTEADVNFKATLENDLGTLAMLTLIKMGYITESYYTGAERAEATGQENSHPKARTYMVRPKVSSTKIAHLPGESLDTLHKDLVRIKDNLNGNDVLAALFQAEGQYEGPRTEMPTKADTKEAIKNSIKKVPEVVQDIITRFNQTEWGVKLGTNNIFEFIGRDGIEDIVGINRDLSGVQKVNHFTIKGQNNTLIAELDAYDTYIENLAKGDISATVYFLNEVWRNIRVGQVASDGVSIQASKIHRFLIGIKAHELDIDPENENYSEVMTEFRTAVMEGFRFKADGEGLGRANTAFQELLQGKTPKHKAILQAVEAVKILNHDLPTDLSAEELRTQVITGVKAGGAKMHSLDAIVALAEYSPDKAFHTNIVREIDGITNGVMIGIAQMAAAEDWQGILDLLEPTGLFANGTTTNTIDKWRDNPGNLDTYQSTATLMAERVGYIKRTMNSPAVYDEHDRSITNAHKRGMKEFRETIGNNPTDERVEEVMTTMDFFLGPMRNLDNTITDEMRDLVKYPVMTNVFGQGIGSITREVAWNTLKENFYNEIEKYHDDPDKIAALRASMETAVGSINLDSTNALGFILEPEQNEKYIKLFANYNGIGLRDAIHGRFGVFIERRNKLNNALTTIHALFMMRYRRAIGKAEEASEDGKISNADRKAIAKELEPIMATFEHYFSDGDVSTELSSVNEKRVNNTSNKDLITQTAHQRLDGSGTKTTRTSRAQEIIWEPPGVGGLISAIHSMDSATMLKVLAEFRVGNIFDAILVSLDQVGKASDAMNESIFQVMTEYSVMEAVNKSLIRAVQSMKEEDRQNEGEASYEEGINRMLITTEEYLNGAKDPDYLGFSFVRADWTTGEPINMPVHTSIDNLVASFQQETNTVTDLREEVFPKILQWIQYNNGRTGYKPSPMALEVAGTEQDIVDTLIEAINIYESPIRYGEREFIDETMKDRVAIEALDIYPITGNNYGLLPDGTLLSEKIKSERNKRKKAKNNSVKEALPTEGTSQSDAEMALLSQSIWQDESPLNLGSSPDAINPANFKPSREEVLTPANTETIHEGLKHIGNKRETAEHSAYLATVLTDLTNKVLTPLNFKLRKQGATTYGSLQADDLYLSVGNMPSLVDGTAMSAQEVFGHELVHAVTRYGLNDPRNYALRKQLTRLFNKSKKVLTPDHFLQRDADGNVVVSPGKTLQLEQEAAQQRYDYIFNNLSGDGLHEFVAMGKTNAKMMELLEGFSGGRESVPGDTLLSRLINFVAQLYDSVYRKIKGTKDLTASGELSDIAAQLAGIHTRKSTMLNKVAESIEAAEGIAIGKVKEWVSEPLLNYLAQPKIVKHKVNAIKFAGTMAQVVKASAMGEFWAVSADVAHRMKIFEKTILANLVTEAVGQTKNNKLFHVLMRKSNYLIDQKRKENIELFTLAAAQNVLTDVTDADKEALGKIGLRGDVAAIFDRYSESQLRKLLTDPSKLRSQIAKVEAQLDQFGPIKFDGEIWNISDYYKKQSNSLGYKMMNGKTLEEHTMDNAFSIARMYGTELAGKATWDVNQAEDIINHLTTLRALDHAAQEHKNLTADFIKREYKANPEFNGFSYMIMDHKKLQEDALEKTFDGQKALMNKGYTKEIFNPNTSFVIAPADMEAELLTQGYIKRPLKLAKDSYDRNQVPLYMYVSKDGLVNTWMKTIVSLTSERAKGANLITVRSQAGDGSPVLNAYADGVRLHKYKLRATRAQFKPGNSMKQTTMAEPVINNEGEITDYRYVMSEKDKVEILEKNDAMDDLLGNMHGSIVDKVNTKTINREAVNLMYDHYQEEFDKHPERFVEIGATASDPEYRELFTMLPDDMKQEVKKVWGGKTMYVKKSMVHLIFGYRKLSVTNINALNKPWLKRIENIWQEVVKVEKDIIVVKSGIVLADNIISNTVQLFYEGLSLSNIKNYQHEGMTAILNYQKALHELIPLERELDIGHKVKNLRAKKARIAQLKDELRFNPIKPLIDAGVFQTIVEDVDLDEDRYTYRNRAEQSIKSFAKPLAKHLPGKVPEGFTKVTDVAFMRHNTVMYKFLKDTTQYSDFVARYALYKHLTQNKNMSSKKAINYISEEFVYYDLPSDPRLQYANDMGLLWFTKFFIRTQKIIGRTAVKAPLKVFGLMMFQGMLGTDMASIMNSTASLGGTLNHLGNPVTVAIDNGGPHLIDLPGNFLE